MVLLDASSIGDHQACQRKGVLARDWRPLRWRPRSLWDACFRSGVLSIVQEGSAAPAAASVAASLFLQSAANPGLDITTDPFLAAKDYCAMLHITLRAAARAGLPTNLLTTPAVRLNSMVEWLPLAQSDGQSLHRWISVDHWGEDDLARELHSWRTIGDISVTKLPMTIHVIEIGRMRGGRRASPWIRAWKHPTMPSLQMRFKGKLPGAFKGWKPLYLTDSHVDPEEWVEQMWGEGAAQELMHHVQVKVPTETQRGVVLRDILSEVQAIRKLQEEKVSWSALPMSRNACDGMVPCQFQHVCYGNASPEESGLYQLQPHRTESALGK